jgi:hypothetical protein
MLTLNTDENRSLQFEVTIQGIDHKKLNGSLKFVVDGIEYGFPVEILSDHISVEVPPLDDIIKIGLREGEVIHCKLDVFGDGFYLNPWNGEFKLKTPVRMEARMTSDDGIVAYKPEPFDKAGAEQQIAKSLTVSLVDDNGVQERTIDEQELDEPLDDERVETKLKPIDHSEKEAQEDADEEMKASKRERSAQEESDTLEKDEILEMLQKILERKERKKTNRPIKRKTVGESRTTKKTLHSRQKKKLVAVTSKTGQTYMVTEAIAAKLGKISQSQKPKRKKVIKKTSDRRSVDINETDPRRLMESVGMKNKNIQKIMLEKAEGMAGDDPAAQVEALKRLLGITKQENVVEEMNRVHDSLRYRKGENGEET